VDMKPTSFLSQCSLFVLREDRIGFRVRVEKVRHGSASMGVYFDNFYFYSSSPRSFFLVWFL